LQSRHILRTISPGGVILFDRNIESPSALFELCKQIREELPIAPFIGVDAEGGAVNRLHTIAPHLAPAMALGATDNEIFSFRQGQLTGKLLFLLGMNLNFAPVVDLALSCSANSIGTRSFGSFPSLVIKMGRGYLRGLNQQGILGMLKHFPGIGESPADPHQQLAKIVKSKKRLLENDIRVFDDLKECSHMIMVGHLLYPALDKETGCPASLSPPIIKELLREKMGFMKIVITDDLEMGAITQEYEINQAALKSLHAGTDMILICHSYDKMLSAYYHLIQSVERGEISDVRIDSSVNRIVHIKKQLQNPAQKFAADEFEEVCQQIEKFSNILAENATTEIIRKKGTPISPEEKITVFYPQKKGKAMGKRADLNNILKKEYGSFFDNLRVVPYNPEKPKLKEKNKSNYSAIILLGNTPSTPLREFFQQVAKNFGRIYFISLNFPADLKQIKPDANLSIYTDMIPFLRTAILILLGKLKPRGKLPIDKKFLITY